MKKINIYFDMDGVLLDTFPYIVKWFLINVPNFDIVKLFKFREQYLLNAFADDFEAFSNIPPMKNAVNLVQTLSDKYEINVLSSYGGNRNRYLARAQNISKYFNGAIDRENIILIPLNTSKEIVYPYIPKGSIVIDDDLINCNNALKCGLKPFWYKYYTPFSTIINNWEKGIKKPSTKNIISVSSFAEIEKYLLGKEY